MKTFSVRVRSGSAATPVQVSKWRVQTLEDAVLMPALIEVACELVCKSVLRAGVLSVLADGEPALSSARYDFKSYSLVVIHSQRRWLQHMASLGIGTVKNKSLWLEPHCLEAFFKEAFGEAVADAFFTRRFIARLGRGNQKRGATPQLIGALAAQPQAGMQRLLSRSSPDRPREERLLAVTKLIVKDHRNSLDLGVAAEEDEDKALSSDFQKSQTPCSFESAAIQCLSARGVLANAGRAIIVSSTTANLRNNPLGGPVLGVPVHLAMMMGKQAAVSNPNILIRGPLKYTGAHLYYNEEGDEVIIPPAGLSPAEAESAIGCMCLRHLVDGDVLALTRSPVVGKQSMVVLPIKIIPGVAIAVPDVILSGLDGDFDGDGVIIYGPKDRAAAEAIESHRVGNLLCHQSGMLAVEVMLDGFLGMELAEKWPVPKSVVCQALSRCADFRPSALPPFLRRADLKSLAAQAAQMGSDFTGDSKIAFALAGPKACADFVHACQAIGACALPLALEPFRLPDMLPEEAFERPVRRLVHALRTRLNGLIECGTASQQRQAYELASPGLLRLFSVGGGTPEAARLAERATCAVLNMDQTSLARIREERKALAPPRPTYVSEDILHMGKVSAGAHTLAFGFCEPCVQTTSRCTAADRVPKDSIHISDSRLASVNSAKLHAHHVQATLANRGLASKANIARTGEVRNKVVAFLSCVRRDSRGGLRGPCNTALLTGWSIPLNIFLKSNAINPKAMVRYPIAEQALPWLPVKRSAFAASSLDDSLNLSTYILEFGVFIAAAAVRKLSRYWRRWTDECKCAEAQTVGAARHGTPKDPRSAEEIFGYELIARCFRAPEDLAVLPASSTRRCTWGRTLVQREFSGERPPLIHGAMLTELPDDLRSIQAADTPACQECGAVDLAAQSELAPCQLCGGEMRPASVVVVFRKNVCSPVSFPLPPKRPCSRCHGFQEFELRVCPITSSCSADSRWVCNLCGEGGSRDPLSPSAQEQEAFARIRRSWAGAAVLRTEFQVSTLAQLGYAKHRKRTFAKHLTSLAKQPCVVANWNVLSCTDGPPLEVVVVYTRLETPDKTEAVLAADVLRRFSCGVVGADCTSGTLRLASTEVKALVTRAVWNVLPGADAAAAAKSLLRSLPLKSRVRVRHNYPASLDLHGPEDTERQMVDDTAGRAVGDGGPARLLAALRTWDGQVLSVANPPIDLGAWSLLDYAQNSTNLRKAWKEAFNKKTVNPTGTKWATVRSDFGVASIQLREAESNPHLPEFLRAQHFNAEPMPFSMNVKMTEDENLFVTHEERARCIGIRQLQLEALHPALQVDAAAPRDQAEQELLSKRIAFFIRRGDYLVSSASLVW